MPQRRVLFFLLEKIDVGFIMNHSSLVLRQHNKGLNKGKNNYEDATDNFSHKHVRERFFFFMLKKNHVIWATCYRIK